MVAIAPGIFLAHSVVPSSGSTAISTSGPALSPTFSPMNSIGASSRSPSPITTVPSIGSLLSSRRMASTAAWSACFSLPCPRSRAADTAARSVTRTISRVRMRSSNSCCGTEIWLDIDALPQTFLAGSSAHNSVTRNPFLRTSVFLDPYHLRPPADHLVALHGFERTVHRILVGGIGDQDDRNPRGVSGGIGPVRVTLHDRFDRYLLLGETGRDRCGRARKVARHQADIVAAFVALHRRLRGRAQPLDRPTERINANAARDVGDVGDHGRRGCRTAGARADQRDRRNALAVDGHRIGDAHHLRDRG